MEFEIGASPTAGKWHSMNLFRLNSCVTTVTRAGYLPVYNLNRSSEKRTFWYESVACVSDVTCKTLILSEYVKKALSVARF